MKSEKASFFKFGACMALRGYVRDAASLVADFISTTFPRPVDGVSTLVL